MDIITSLPARQGAVHSLFCVCSSCSGVALADRLGAAPGGAPVPAAGSETGRPNNIGLSNFAKNTTIPLSDAEKALRIAQVKKDALADKEDHSPLLTSDIIRGILPATVRISSRVIAPIVLHRGFDTIHWSFPLLEQQFNRLHSWASEVINYKDGSAEMGSLTVGIRRAGGSYSYRITAPNGLSWQIPRDIKFPMMVLCGPEYLLSLPPEQLENDAWGWSCEILNQPELYDTNMLSISRIDECLDIIMTDEAFQEFCRMVKNRDSTLVTRARKFTPFMDLNRDTGLLIGKNAVVLRVYDKILEAKNTDIDFWMRVWDFPSIPDGSIVVRIEYQLRRDILRSFKSDGMRSGIYTMEQYKKAAPIVLLYLTQAWFRFAGKERTKENYRVTKPWWQGVSDAFVVGRFFSAADVDRIWRDVKKFVSRDDKKLMAMAAGCLSSVAAIWGARDGLGAPLPLVDVLNLLQSHISANGGIDDWNDAAFDRLYKIVYNLPK